MQLLNNNLAVKLIIEEKKEKVTESGLILMGGADDTPDLSVGIVVGVSDDIIHLNIGDKILFKLADALTGVANNEDYVFMPYEAVVAKI